MIKWMWMWWIVVAVWFAFLAIWFSTQAKAEPQYCTPAKNSAPYQHICTGYGQSCSIWFDNCSPTPDEPGTWNPRGYTPKIG